MEFITFSLYNIYITQFFVIFCVILYILRPARTLKVVLVSKNDFDQRTACRAPIGWSKYPTGRCVFFLEEICYLMTPSQGDKLTCTLHKSLIFFNKKCTTLKNSPLCPPCQPIVIYCRHFLLTMSFASFICFLVKILWQILKEKKLRTNSNA